MKTKMKLVLAVSHVVVAVLSQVTLAQSLGEAPEALSRGPYGGIQTLEYRAPATTDAFVLPDRITELWGSISGIL